MRNRTYRDPVVYTLRSARIVHQLPGLRVDYFARFDHIVRMQTVTANEAKTRFGEFLDRAQREPVQVLKHDRVIGVLVSAQDYEDMRTFYAARLATTLQETARKASAAGLTETELDRLLADES